MLAYSQLEEQHREKSKNLIKRQLQAGRERERDYILTSLLVDPSQKPSDEKVEELLESQDLSVFTQDVK